MQNQGAAEVIFEQAVSDFERGLIDEAAVAFDTVAELLPRQAPHLWQRGIALYYAARYDDCREQFESHRTVNPNDVENAVWHFLCVAQAESAEVARTQLLPVGPDGRVPMREVYQMFQGTLMPMQVLDAAGNNPSGQFFAHLYLGLYFEAIKKPIEALDHIQMAAADRYSRVGGYMHMVARVHLEILQSP
jgi:lipoprotein NlpI